jgi:hypothetical protein
MAEISFRKSMHLNLIKHTSSRTISCSSLALKKLTMKILRTLKRHKKALMGKKRNKLDTAFKLSCTHISSVPLTASRYLSM